MGKRSSAVRRHKGIRYERSAICGAVSACIESSARFQVAALVFHEGVYLEEDEASYGYGGKSDCFGK